MQYRKKPIIIEAKQVPTYEAQRVVAYVDECVALAEWCGGKSYMMEQANSDNHILIPTLEGDMKAKSGDFIIKGVKGEFYPCKPDIFEATYEPVTLSQ